VVGRDRIYFLGRDPWPVATGFFFWVATDFRTFGSRPDPVATHGSMVPNTKELPAKNLISPEDKRFVKLLIIGERWRTTANGYLPFVF
jgi:hypothetical protein